ncbi:solute carrier family 41 [Nematocida ausubeli]|nr:solute carrier family 41 [Nematocida ausubeli]KAI5161054.1 solute carrier family 41 [Nematocida ausubeli]
MVVDMKEMRELIPSLSISLCGLFLMSMTLHLHLDGQYIKPMHYLFILNSMLCFKNNIELNYADIMSSCVKKTRRYRGSISSLSLIEYVFDSGLSMFFVSTGFSILIGIFSNYRNILEVFMQTDIQKNLLLVCGTISASFLSGACSCICTFICVVFCIFMSISFDFDSDNILLPVIASLSDYICTISLIYFSENIFISMGKMYPLNTAEPITVPGFYSQVFITNTLLICMIVAILGIIYTQIEGTQNLKLFGAWSLALSFGITMVAGHLINVVSTKDVWMGCIIPLFNGIAGSVILIYVGKVTTYISALEIEENFDTISISSAEDTKSGSFMSNPNNIKTLYTLICTATFLAAAACCLLKLFFTAIPFMYILFFGALLNVEIILLYYTTNILVIILQYFDMDVSYNIVPILNALSDLFGICVLAGASYLVLV